MFTKIKRWLLSAPLFLAACGAQEGAPVPFFGGPEAGGFELQTGCSSVLDNAGCASATRDADGNIVLHGVQNKDSVAGKVTTGLSVSLPNKVADYLIASELQKQSNCDDGDCGGDTFVLQGGQGGQAQAVADVDADVDVNANASTGRCDGRPCLGTMD